MKLRCATTYLIIILNLSLSLGGCQQQSTTPQLDTQRYPGQWQQPHNSERLRSGWLQGFDTPQLIELVEQAVAANYNLAEQRLLLAQAQQRIKVVRADRLPSLGLGFSVSRSRTILGGNQITLETPGVNEFYNVNITLNFDLDIWGRLRDAQRQAVLQLASQRAQYLGAEQQLAAQVVSSTFDVAAAGQLQHLLNNRLASLESSLDVIERGYRSGLNEALDVYLAQTTVAQERANVANQQQASFAAHSDLALLLAEYPNASLALADELAKGLPPLSEAIPAGTPTDVLQRRPDIHQAWLDLLAADAGVAVAHKNRFPSLNLVSTISNRDVGFRQLIDNGEFAWSVAGSVLQPLFQGGRLRALEKQARLQLEQAEQRYLSTVFNAFAEVETELTRAHTLQDSYEAFLQAQDNAQAALVLAADQYRRGLADYTTVLEAQRRAFDAQNTVIGLKNQLLQNRVNLHLALGNTWRSQ